MNDIYVEKVNEVYLRVWSSDDGIEEEICTNFTFDVPGAQFSPAFKSRLWDGKLRLYSRYKKLLYTGLMHQLETFASNHGYMIIQLNEVYSFDAFSPHESQEFVDSLQLSNSEGHQLVVRDYQYTAIHHAISNQRALLLAATASGKSSIIYSLIRYHLMYDRRCLIVVPTTMLVQQMYHDFQDYSTLNGFNVAEITSMLYAGKTIDPEHRILITTWQSIFRWTSDELNSYDCIVIDEAHGIKASSMTKILEKMPDTKYRIGTTGTLDKSKCNKLVIEGLTGKVFNVARTHELIKNHHISDLKIKCLILKHPSDICKLSTKLTYAQEIEYLVLNEKRNRFIINLALATTGNTLILFQLVEKHGKVLYTQIRERAKGRPVYFIHGQIKSELREKMRLEIQSDTNAIIVASYPTLSTGANIPSIENIIFASPTKSKIRSLQSIGRGLRLHEGKSSCRLFDISDDLSYRKHMNYTMKHLQERLSIYADEQFDFKLEQIVI